MTKTGSSLWKGNWRTRARVISGLILFAYILFHFINIGLGIFSLDAMERFQDIRQAIHRSLLGTVLLYGALFIHMGLALYRLARRRTLKMPAWEAFQIILGLLIPLLLMAHIVHTRMAHDFFGLNDRMGYLVGLIWDTTSGWNQSALLLITWTHGCMGLHFWLRSQAWWRNSLLILISLATLIPAWALTGFMVQGRQQKALFRDPETFPALAEQYNWLSAEQFAYLLQATNRNLLIFGAIVLITLAIHLTRRFVINRGAVPIRYVSGPEIRGQRGMTLLEMSRSNGVEHMALCGGKGRCTTCRVIIEEGADLLHPPSAEEAASLRAVNAPPNARLACQLRPTNSATVLQVFRGDGRRARAHQSLGQERGMAILFLDMRGFTARTTGQLPYDVVFLLNRFFDAIVPSITGAGGTVDKYLGDGLLAVFEQDDEQASAQAALDAAAGISAALATFNQTLKAEKAPPVAIGMGLHLGTLVMGEIGAAENAPRTIIGDTVNATSRLEGKTKELAVEALISKDLLEAAGHDTSRFEFVDLELRGVAHPMPALPVKQAATLPDILSSEAIPVQ
ncbi:adenylate/guanylate cyclase domain-containing protein [Shimia haliotis]|uniref:Adenylate/guanylate cyclase n=1 Tax=Shimia haliotis TaxID=1280847 RepID=A0A1I4F4G5_9RHOB|nr:adenylate/guanylate cyclase domain-containing protein [Shimia haliotis]SFL12875.1 adenylate/guanylate cyclase [Shimia haliotis]